MPGSRTEYLKSWRAQHHDYMKGWFERHPGYMKMKNRTALLRRHGLTHEEYDAKVLAQGNWCAMCGDEQKCGDRLFVDHHHATGQRRALLCHDCNIMIARESVEIFAAGIEYLNKWKEQLP